MFCCQSQTVFIGSRLNDSMLLRLSFKEPDAVVDLSEVPDILVEKPEVVTIDAGRCLIGVVTRVRVF